MSTKTVHEDYGSTEAKEEPVIVKKDEDKKVEDQNAEDNKIENKTFAQMCYRKPAQKRPYDSKKFHEFRERRKEAEDLGSICRLSFSLLGQSRVLLTMRFLSPA